MNGVLPKRQSAAVSSPPGSVQLHLTLSLFRRRQFELPVAGDKAKIGGLPPLDAGILFPVRWQFKHL